MRVAVEIGVGHDPRRMRMAPVVIDARADVEQIGCDAGSQGGFGRKPRHQARQQAVSKRGTPLGALRVVGSELPPQCAHRRALHLLHCRGLVCRGWGGSQSNSLAQAVAGNGQMRREEAIHDRLYDQRTADDGVGPIAIQSWHPPSIGGGGA